MSLCNEIQITKACNCHSAGIVDLFNANYTNKYHYENFTSPAKLAKILDSNMFSGWVVLSEDEKVIGFSGVYIESKEWLKVIKLAHLLVDKEYRG